MWVQCLNLKTKQTNKQKITNKQTKSNPVWDKCKGETLLCYKLPLGKLALPDILLLSQGRYPIHIYIYRRVGLVVKAPASGAEDPGFESRLQRDFSG